MTAPSPRPLAGMFLRVLLSHLVVVLLCLVAGALTFDYLFGTGVRYFLVHDPVFLVPVMLVLIGLAGLLAVWTTAGMSLPIENMTEALAAPDSTARLEELSRARHTAESRQLLDALRDTLARAPRQTLPAATPVSHADPLVELDASGTILSVSPAAADLAGASPLSLVGRSFAEVFAPDEPDDVAAAFATWMRPDVSTFRLAARLHRSDTTFDTIHWHAVALRGMFGPTGSWILRPIDIEGADAARAD
jgi:PAS domain S-box-containing protein